MYMAYFTKKKIEPFIHKIETSIEYDTNNKFLKILLKLIFVIPMVFFLLFAPLVLAFGFISLFY